MAEQTPKPTRMEKWVFLSLGTLGWILLGFTVRGEELTIPTDWISSKYLRSGFLLLVLLVKFCFVCWILHIFETAKKEVAIAAAEIGFKIIRSRKGYWYYFSSAHHWYIGLHIYYLPWWLAFFSQIVASGPHR